MEYIVSPEVRPVPANRLAKNPRTRAIVEPKLSAKSPRSVHESVPVDPLPRPRKPSLVLPKPMPETSSKPAPQPETDTGDTEEYVSAAVDKLESLGDLPFDVDGLQAELLHEFPDLSGVLTVIAQIHPFVSVAVVAFRAAFELYKTRRDNDKKVHIVYRAMRDMMITLVTLRKRGQVKHAIGRFTVYRRLRILCKEASEEITTCANVCDAYLKQGPISKWGKAFLWKSKFSQIMEAFSTREKAFGEAIQLSTLETVDSIEAKLDKYLATFKILSDAEEQDFNRGAHRDDLQARSRNLGALDSETRDTAREPDDVIRTNCDTFQRKFDILCTTELQHMQRNLIDHMNLVERNVVNALGGRSQHWLLVKDKVLREIWQDMRWKRNVDTNRFVTTLRDYFREKYKASFSIKDMWALKYTDLAWLKPLSEALDADSSGYVTIGEINQFTSACPPVLGWRLPHWIAYWSIGWQLASNDYRIKIHDIVAEMTGMIPFIHRHNRGDVARYLVVLRRMVAELTFSLRATDSKIVPPKTLDKFAPFISYERTRIHENLEKVHFHLDALDAVQVITGSGRIEEHMLTVLFCMLQRHLQFFKLALRHPLSPLEFIDLRNSLRVLYVAVQNRIEDLVVSFRQRGLKPNEEFQTFACGLLEYMHNHNDLWSMARLKNPGVLEQFNLRSPFPFKLPSVDLLDGKFPTADENARILQHTGSNGKNSGGILRVMRHHYITCASGCKTSDVEPHRFICLDCTDLTAQLEDVVSCCSLKGCFERNIPRKRGLKTHRPTHDAVKLFVEVGWMDLPRIYGAARRTLWEARQQLYASHRDGSTPDSGSSGLHCAACKRMMRMELCWCCMTCTGYFLCDECEARSLFQCLSCHKSVSLPSWYYGYRRDDCFRCEPCIKRSSTRPQLSDDERLKQHFYTHSLVRCKPRLEDPAEIPDTQRLIAVEKRCDALLTKTDHLLSRLGVGVHR